MTLFALWFLYFLSNHWGKYIKMKERRKHVKWEEWFKIIFFTEPSLLLRQVPLNSKGGGGVRGKERERKTGKAECWNYMLQNSTFFFSVCPALLTQKHTILTWPYMPHQSAQGSPFRNISWHRLAWASSNQWHGGVHMIRIGRPIRNKSISIDTNGAINGLVSIQGLWRGNQGGERWPHVSV